MCTAATYLTGDFYFGRNLDYEFSYGDEVTITPRNYPFHFRSLEKELTAHYAMIGMAYIAGDYPLYYDAVNEKGLCIAGLNFVGNAAYQEPVPEKDNVAQFELIPWLLGQCASVKEARELIARMNLTNIPFSEKLPLAQLHWLISDRNRIHHPGGHERRPSHLRQSRRRSHQQSALPLSDVPAQQLYAALPGQPGESFFQRVDLSRLTAAVWEPSDFLAISLPSPVSSGPLSRK